MGDGSSKAEGRDREEGVWQTEKTVDITNWMAVCTIKGEANLGGRFE